MPSGKIETSQECYCLSDESPLNFQIFLLAYLDTDICPDKWKFSVLHILMNWSQLLQSGWVPMLWLTKDFAFGLTLETQNKLKNLTCGKVNSEMETKHWNADMEWFLKVKIKPSNSYPQIFYTIARKKNKQSIENKIKKNIYPSYVYLYINSYS